MKAIQTIRISSLAATIFIGASALHADTLEGVQTFLTGLNQPMFMTQAPGNDALYYIVERNDGGGQLGRIRVYNKNSGNIWTFLDLTGSIVSDGGVLAMAFHPEYPSNGKFYITSVVDRTNRLDEYMLVNGVPTFQRRLLEYENLENIFHTINQPLFRPDGDNNELFVTTGDGGTQANDGDFNPGLITSPDSSFGKVMKVDLSADFSGGPLDAPDGAKVEVVSLGHRNGFRSSFDRATGDFYMGDVGFNTAEEVNFIPNSHFENGGPILDFGWTQREGTAETNPSPPGGPGGPNDINPIFDYAHAGQQGDIINDPGFTGASITGGYVYRGPIDELKGRYFFADFVTNRVYSGVFDPSTDPGDYDGANLMDIIDHTANFESLNGGNINFIVSFGEDNLGNLYIVDFGTSFFPPLGTGEIFVLVPEPTSLAFLALGGMTLLRRHS